MLVISTTARRPCLCCKTSEESIAIYQVWAPEIFSWLCAVLILNLLLRLTWAVLEGEMRQKHHLRPNRATTYILTTMGRCVSEPAKCFLYDRFKPVPLTLHCFSPNIHSAYLSSESHLWATYITAYPFGLQSVTSYCYWNVFKTEINMSYWAIT